MESHDLCDDLLAQVLLMLPLASLTRFQRVNSSWRRIILSNPSLESRRRLIEHYQHVVGFYYTSINRSEPLYFQPLPRVPLPASEEQLDKPQYTRATCGSLVLICGRDAYFVRNPMAYTTVIVSPPPVQQVRPKFYGLAASCGEFEIICISPSSVSLAFMYSYSSSGDSWTPLEMDSEILKLLMGNLNYLNPAGAAFARQSLHWLLKDGRIAAFNVEERTWRVMESPAVGKVDTRRRYIVYRPPGRFIPITDYKSYFNSYPDVWFGSVRSCLYLVTVTDGKDLQVWMLDNNDGDEWTMIAEIKGSASPDERIKPLLFDGRRIGIASLEHWNLHMPIIRFFDTFKMKWQKDKLRKRQRDRLILGKILTSNWFFFPCIREEGVPLPP